MQNKTISCINFEFCVLAMLDVCLQMYLRLHMLDMFLF